MTNQDPRLDPRWVPCRSVEVNDDTVRLLSFPDGVRCLTRVDQSETELISNQIFAKQEYLAHGLSFQNCSVVFDVGASIGLFTVFAKMQSSGAVAYAFEPIREAYEVFLRNVQLHGLDRVNAYHCAVGSKAQAERSFTFYPNMAGNSTANAAVKAPQRKVMNDLFGTEETDRCFQSQPRIARVETLSAVIDRYGITRIDYLKIDVEGDELAVLQGLRDEHAAMIRQVAVEVHSEPLARDVTAYLERHGFETACDTGLSAGAGVRTVSAIRP